MVQFTQFTEEDAGKSAEEIFGNIPSDESIEMKDVPFEDKIRFLKYCMNYTDLINSAVLTNISFLVFGKNISDEAFANKNILFKNLEEYVDAKYELKAEIGKYATDLLKFYLGSIKSYSAILPDGKIDIPSSYRVILMSADISDISKLMIKYKIDYDDIPLVHGANVLVDSFRFSDMSVINDFINHVMDGLKK